MKHFGDLMFTDRVKAEQSAQGSRGAYEKMTAQPPPAGFTEREAAFIGARDSFYMATVNEDGWPYVQHRGGPIGFLKVLGPTTLGFADYGGNKQYVSSGNLKSDDRAALILVDYPARRRMKVLARVSQQPAEADPDLAARLAIEGQGRVERLFTLEVEAFDWNCPQFLTPRFTEDQIREVVGEKFSALEAENAKLRARVAELEAAR